MTELVKTYERDGKTVFEMSVTALTEEGARTRAVPAVLGRYPSQIPAVDSIEVATLDGGSGFKDYRVIVEIANEGDVGDVTGLDKLKQRLRDLL